MKYENDSLSSTAPTKRVMPQLKKSIPDLNRRTQYRYQVDLSNDSSAAKIIHLIGKEKDVLDVGAGAGIITKILANERGCRVTAVEIDPDACSELEFFTERVIRVDLNCFESLKELDRLETFDAVIVADVLEHLYDPWSVIEALTSRLQPKGQFLTSIPHAGHAGVIASLLTGDLRYRDWGLLDKTHVRFFGINDIRHLHTHASLRIVEQQHVIKHPEETELAEE
jgi:2-polyprenyl-3-methyl-5-hydroxy-6-metoxy-1,4-benzoquinol methylase